MVPLLVQLALSGLCRLRLAPSRVGLTAEGARRLLFEGLEDSVQEPVPGIWCCESK